MRLSKKKKSTITKLGFSDFGGEREVFEKNLAIEIERGFLILRYMHEGFRLYNPNKGHF